MQSVSTLLAAAQNDDAAAVDRLLRETPSLATVEGPHPVWGGQPTALHIAAERGNTAIGERLLAAGADPSHPSTLYDGWTPLLIAIQRTHTPFVDLLIARGARIDAWEAAALGDAARLKSLLAADPSIARVSRTNDAPPLHFAQTVDVARLLVDAGAPLDAIDEYGRTAARAAAYAGARRAAVARYLMSLTGERDLWLYAALDDEAGLAALVAEGANVSPSGPGETPLHTAANLGNANAARFLLAHGADPSAKDVNGANPLHFAAMNGSRETVDLLLTAGADTSVRDATHNATPADWAKYFGHSELSERIRRRQ